MDEHAQEMLDIIESSFLSKEEKYGLKDQLQREGLSEPFLANMNEKLIAALGKMSALYDGIVDAYETQDKLIRGAYETKKNDIETELEKKLAGIDITDLLAKEKIFDWYRKETDTNQNRYDKAIKELFANLSRQVIFR